MTTKTNMVQVAAKGFKTLHKILAPVGVWLAVLVVLAGLSSPAWAQLDTGSVGGTVTDPSGKVVAGAAVTAHEVATGTNYATITSSTGYYSFPSMRIGTYEVKASASGFKAAVYRGVVVSIGSHTGRDVVMTVGAATESVNVVAGTVSLESETSDIDEIITPEQVQDLPLAVGGSLRSLSAFEFLVPGAVGPGTSSGGSGFQMTKINGGQEEGTDYLLDGITTNRM